MTLTHAALLALSFSSAHALRFVARAPTVRATATAVGVGALLDTVAASGPVGILASDEEQAAVEATAAALAGTSDEAAQARVPLGGTYDLLYSAAKGGSNGKVGPFVGTVSQIIVDEKAFINQVQLFGGLLTVRLRAEREILDDERIRVSFVETVFQLFGRDVKRSPTKGQGVWEQVYVEGNGPDGTASLRVMRTPSLFVLRQRPPE